MSASHRDFKVCRSNVLGDQMSLGHFIGLLSTICITPILQMITTYLLSYQMMVTSVIYL